MMTTRPVSAILHNVWFHNSRGGDVNVVSKLNGLLWLINSKILLP